MVLGRGVGFWGGWGGLCGLGGALSLDLGCWGRGLALHFGGGVSWGGGEVTAWVWVIFSLVLLVLGGGSGFGKTGPKLGGFGSNLPVPKGTRGGGAGAWGGPQNTGAAPQGQA